MLIEVRSPVKGVKDTLLSVLALNVGNVNCLEQNPLDLSRSKFDVRVRSHLHLNTSNENRDGFLHLSCTFAYPHISEVLWHYNLETKNS